LYSEAKKTNHYSNTINNYNSKESDQQQQYFTNIKGNNDKTKINSVINDDVNNLNDEYEITDFINVKRYSEKSKENESILKPLKKENIPINRHIHHYNITSENKQDIKVQKLIYKSKLLKKKETFGIFLILLVIYITFFHFLIIN